MDSIFIIGIIGFGPLLFFMFYAHDIFGLSKFSPLIYISGLAIGFLWWEPLVSITLTLSWLLVIGSWAYIVIGIFRYK